jgi:hypothetical protein
MNRLIKVGLIAEGRTELGFSVPDIKPEDGGKIISRKNEGALHTLIRRELKEAGLPDCDFVQRHPSMKESNNNQRRTGHGILDPKYLAQIVIAWKPEEVDLIVIVADADDQFIQRQSELISALKTIQNYHLDINENIIEDQSVGGLSIRNFETWLLADNQTISKILGIEILVPENLEDSSKTKKILEKAIAKSEYLVEANNRKLEIRWHLADQIDLAILRKSCPQGYGLFSQNLLKLTQIFIQKLL